MSETAQLPAGRELDALVAERVMGWRRSDDPAEVGMALVGGVPVLYVTDDGALIVARRNNPAEWLPSTDIAAAWEVLEALIARGWCPDVIYGADADGPYWGCRLDSADEDEGERIIVRHANAAPLAICRAALAAVEALAPEPTP